MASPDTVLDLLRAAGWGDVVDLAARSLCSIEHVETHHRRDRAMKISTSREMWHVVAGDLTGPGDLHLYATVMRTSITTDDEPFAAQVTVTIAETEHFPTLEAMTWASYDWDGPSTVRRISPPDPDATPPADH